MVLFDDDKLDYVAGLTNAELSSLMKLTSKDIRRLSVLHRTTKDLAYDQVFLKGSSLSIAFQRNWNDSQN